MGTTSSRYCSTAQMGGTEHEGRTRIAPPSSRGQKPPRLINEVLQWGGFVRRGGGTIRGGPGGLYTGGG